MLSTPLPLFLEKQTKKGGDVEMNESMHLRSM